MEEMRHMTDNKMAHVTSGGVNRDGYEVDGYEERQVQRRKTDNEEYHIVQVSPIWNDQRFQVGNQSKGPMRMSDIPGFMTDIVAGGSTMDVDDEVEAKVSEAEYDGVTAVMVLVEAQSHRATNSDL